MNKLEEKIAEHPFFKGITPAHLEILFYEATEQGFKTGEVVFREMEPANTFYLIEEGSVALEAHRPDDGSMLIQVLKAGDVVGWSWLFPPFIWHFQARALEPTSNNWLKTPFGYCRS